MFQMFLAVTLKSFKVESVHLCYYFIVLNFLLKITIQKWVEVLSLLGLAVSDL